MTMGTRWGGWFGRGGRSRLGAGEARRGSSRWPALAGATLLIAAWAPGAAAQDPGDPADMGPGAADDWRYAPQEEPAGTSLVIAPTLGVLAPLSDLAATGADGSAELSTAVAVGGAASVWFGAFGFAVQGAYAAPEITVQTTDPATGIPEVRSFGGATWLAGTANLMYRPAATGGDAVLLPYLAIGAGLRRFDPGDEVTAAAGGGTGEATAGLEEATDPVGTVALGALVDLGGGLAARVELRDYVSEYDPAGPREPSLQNELNLSIGLGLKLR